MTTTDIIREARAAAREGRPMGTPVAIPPVNFTEGSTGNPTPTTTIKGIVIRAPMWADIALGIKTIEYRSWKCSHRGSLAICAAKERSAGAFAGCAVCVVDMTDCVCRGPKNFEWVLSNPRLIEPVPVAGRLGMLDLSIPLDFDVQWDEG